MINDSINNNIINKFKINNVGLNKSINKISSGSRINAAADDAAGLGMSEKMKALIRGLDQASRNIQDGINAVNVADSGLGTIANPLLMRLEQLAVQAANGTYNEQEIRLMQNEADSILREIDKIANTTNFNGIYLLNGSKPGDEYYGQSNISEFDYKDVLKLPSASANGQLAFYTDKGYPTTSFDDNKKLVFGGGSTSFPSVNVNGKDYYFLNNPGASYPAGVTMTKQPLVVEDGKYITKFSVKDTTTVPHVDVQWSKPWKAIFIASACTVAVALLANYFPLKKINKTVIVEGISGVE